MPLQTGVWIHPCWCWVPKNIRPRRQWSSAQGLHDLHEIHDTMQISNRMYWWRRLDMYPHMQSCGVDRVFIGVDSDSGVGVLMSTPTPTSRPTPACLEWIALCNVQFLCIGHSYARHLIVGQVKLQAGPKRDDPTWTRWLLPPYHNWTLFAIALDQRKTIFGRSLSRAPRAGALYMANVTVQ